MDIVPGILYMVHVPSEWLTFELNYENLLNSVYTLSENYAYIHGTYEGLVLTINGCAAELLINDFKKKWWYRRVDVDDRAPNEDYYPPLPPEEENNDDDSGVEE
ncbi:hypothetical protein PV326_000367 [Microctonus aethiopoides]|nr:hypothetical protein PV326_000367 [Microctonus aethiopoides]